MGTFGFQGGFIERVNRFWSLLALLTALSLVALACSVRPPVPPDFRVPMPANDFGEFVVEVYDSAELLLDARAMAAAGEGRPQGSVVARPDRNELDVAWTGGACAPRPLINVRGTPDALTVELVPDPADIGLVVVPQDCPAVGIYFGVTLTLSEPVDQANVTLTLSD